MACKIRPGDVVCYDSIQPDRLLPAMIDSVIPQLKDDGKPDHSKPPLLNLIVFLSGYSGQVFFKLSVRHKSDMAKPTDRNFYQLRQEVAIDDEYDFELAKRDVAKTAKSK